MKKIILILTILLVSSSSCFGADGISFIYINGSNNNDTKMKNWYENGVKELHPVLRQEFYESSLAKQYFLKNGKYDIEKEPRIFFWGDKSQNDLNFLNNNLAISKSETPWVAYKVRWLIAHFMHDAIWVQKYHNMKPILDSLNEMVKKETNAGNKVVLYGYSAGSFVTYQYLLTRLTYVNVSDFFNNLNTPADEKEFISKHPMKNTCIEGIGASKLATLSATGTIIKNPDSKQFRENYLKLDENTENVCAPIDSIKGIVNFASPLVLFYSDISDPNFVLTYYNKLLYEYIFEKDLFWLTVNYREDPMGYPTTRNLTIEEIEQTTQMDIDPHAGFIYDWSVTPSKRTFMGAHTAYWSTKKRFSNAVVTAYDNGYRHHYDKEFQKKAVKDYLRRLKRTQDSY